MPRRKKIRVGRKRTVFPNPYLPALLTLHERWTPTQIAGAITRIDDEMWLAGKIGANELSQKLVLILSQQTQTSGNPSVNRGDTGGPFGICRSCNMRRADLIVGQGDDVTALCNACYGMTVGDVERPKVRRERDQMEQEPPEGYAAGGKEEAAGRAEGHERETDGDE